MTTEEIKAYYDATSTRNIRAELEQAVAMVGEPRVAIDCGCGAGADIAFLRQHHFVVHAFDIEAESIQRCTQRFKDDTAVHLSQTSFDSFNYPSAGLIVADASLFFCRPDKFDGVWQRITDALVAGGVFSGSFLGPNDTMATADFDKQAFWPEVLTQTEAQLRPRFKNFDIISWTEHEQQGKTAQGVAHQWHIFAVVARKI